VSNRLLALLLILGLAPGVTEVVEAVVHYAAYGDLADRPGDDHGGRPLGVGEHGCSGTFHLGDCHGGQAVSFAARIDAVSILAALYAPIMPLPRSLHGLPAAAPELRPPIA
jgi:hypothetical protein